MKTLARLAALWLFVAVAASLTGCFGNGSGPSSPTPAPGAPLNDNIRVGDKITIQLTGVPDPSNNAYFVEKQVPASGDINLPLLTQSFHAADTSASALAEEITAAYKNQRIYTNPVITVLAEERFVTVGGDVRSPASVPSRPDLTVISAINTCGGFTEFANRRSVRVIRGKAVFYVDCIKAAATAGADPAVYPGDQIYVPRTPF